MLGTDSRSGRAGALSRILILGGYGGFGGRLTRRLAAAGHHVLVAGRSEDRAIAFCAGIPDTLPVLADREGDIDSVLARHRPDLLIDAAGPFQGSSYRVPLACARASIPYLDLADARDFVTGIGSLDEAARAGGVPLLSGASSVPALSGAVARHLARGLDRVRKVEAAISASNRAIAGSSVSAAILSYVGRPLRLWRGGRWTKGWGWQEAKRATFAIDGIPPLRGRWLALADVPDHELLPEALPGRPAVTFRAGTEFAHQMLGLWLLSWPARWLGLRSLAWLAPALLPVQHIVRAFSDDRSAMEVRLAGAAGETDLERRWTLIAEQGDGPEIPTLAAAILAEKLLSGEVPSGARDAGGLLDLADFEPLFARLSIRHQIVETVSPPPLYERVMGPRFAALPPAVRTIHSLRDGGAAGEGMVTRGRNPFAALIASLMRFPPAGRHPLHVAFEERRGVETWTRHFGARSFSSALSAHSGCVVERFGPMSFHFDLPSDGEGLRMVMRRWTLLGLPLPLALAPKSPAREWEDDGRFHFDVPISLPLIGLVVHYRGWLIPPTKDFPVPASRAMGSR